MKLNFGSKNLLIGTLSVILCLNLSGCNESPKQEVSDLAVNSSPVNTSTGNSVNEADDKNLVDLSTDNREEFVLVNIRTTGKINPFASYNERTSLRASGNGYSNKYLNDPLLSNLSSPPVNLSENPEMSVMINSKVVGILYDGAKSSAIVNINGEDHLVRMGDNILNLNIQKISKDNITIKNGYNTYNVALGESINKPSRNTIDHLNTKFAGNERSLPNIKLKPILLENL